MKKYITRIFAVIVFASMIGSITSCSVEYRERHHHDDHYDHHDDHHYDHY